MHRPRTLIVLLLLAVAGGACTGADEPATVDPPPAAAAVSEPAAPTAPAIEGGTVVYGADAAPSTLNPWVAPTRDTTTLVTRPVLAPLWRVTPDGDLEPWLLAGEPTVSGGDDSQPFTVDYELRGDAVWSDGRPIDGDDLLFTLSACRTLLTSGGGDPTCAAVDEDRSSADGRRATVVFTRPVAAWRTLLASLPVLPKHVLAGRDLRTAWRDRLPVSSGPFAFRSWRPGGRLVLERNDRWWGEPAPLDRLEFTFDDDRSDAPPAGGVDVDAVLAGDVDVVAGDASLADLERARAGGGVRVSVAASDRWDGIDFNPATPPVARAAVRRALAAAVDRRVISDELIAPIVPATTVPDGLLQPPDAAAADQATAAASERVDPATELERAGCGRGGDDVLVCDGQRMELTLARAGGRWRHRILAEYVVEQLAQAGVVVNVAARTAAASPDGWDLRMVTVASDLDAAGTGARWRCEAPANSQAFCRTAYDDLLDRALRTPDAERRAALVDQAEQILDRSRPTLPLATVPTMLAAREDVRGPTVNPGPWGPTWNTETWARTAR